MINKTVLMIANCGFGANMSKYAALSACVPRCIRG